MWDLSSLTRGELASLALEVQSLNRWTAKEVPVLSFIKQAKIIIKAPQPQMIQSPESRLQQSPGGLNMVGCRPGWNHFLRPPATLSTNGSDTHPGKRFLSPLTAPVASSLSLAYLALSVQNKAGIMEGWWAVHPLKHQALRGDHGVQRLPRPHLSQGVRLHPTP